MAVTSVRRRTLLVLCAVLLTACGSPGEPLNIGIREVAHDIVLGGGEEEDVPPPPVPPTAVEVSLPQTTSEQSQPRFSEPPSPPPAPAEDRATPPPVQIPPDADVDACPSADPRDAPRLEAPTDRAIPPVEATYTYRNDGGFEVSGANANEGLFTEPTSWTVKDVEINEPDFTFAVEAVLGGTVTTSHYEVRNEPTVPDPSDALTQTDPQRGRGLYLTRLHSERTDGRTSTFEPAPALLLMPFPATVGDDFEVAGTDPVSGTTMSYHLEVVGKNRVDACGEPLDAVRMELTQGRVTGPSMQVEFAAVYDFGTQFGGLMLRNEFAIAGTEGLNTVSRENVATISEVPDHRREQAR